MFFEKIRRAIAYLRFGPSLRVRLVGFFVFIFGSTLLVFSTLLYRVFVTNHQKNFDDTLFNYAVDIAYSIDVDFFGELRLSPNVLRQSEKSFPFALGETFLQLRSFTGGSLVRSKNMGSGTLPFTPEDRQATVDHKTTFLYLSRDDATKMGLPAREYRVLDYLIEKSPGYGLILQVAAPMLLLQKERKGLITFFSFSIPFILIVALLGGLYVANRALAPVNAIIDKTRSLSAYRLSERVPVPRNKDEIQDLAKTLNGLLDRLERSFLSQESFIADASHQLKTPLAILRGELDLMNSRQRSPEEMNSFVVSATEEVSYLSRMIEELLILARMDAGEQSLQLRQVRVDEVLLDCVARLEKLAAKKHVKLAVNFDSPETETDGDQFFVVKADPDLVRSLFETLIENAIKYSLDDGGLVTVILSQTADTVRFVVKDQGEGIAAEAVPKIFERFYRFEKVPGKKTGAGLGLAIAKKIVEVHNGAITVESELGKGASFIVSLNKSWS
jgi:signal transduction histidine kinase